MLHPQSWEKPPETHLLTFSPFPIFRTPPGIDTPTLGGVFSVSGGEKQGRPCVHSPCPVCPKEAHLPQLVLKSRHISCRRGPGHSKDQDYVNSVWAGEAVVLTPRVFTAPKGFQVRSLILRFQ